MADPMLSVLPDGSVRFSSGKSTSFESVQKVTLKALAAIETRSAKLFGATISNLKLTNTPASILDKAEGGAYVCMTTHNAWMPDTLLQQRCCYI
jgi:hypothetical protein